MMVHRLAVCFLMFMLYTTYSANGAEANVVRRASNRFQTGAQRRQAIRAMPLLERPYRVGHFYGNTVRRIHHRRHQRR